uniref:ARAD1A02530p n=1 Tax=Blastobotrys adeninivorans TaxID=409370 RepID=A0A060T1S9_BLAAD
MEYRNDILCHWQDLYQKTRCNPNMIDIQPELEWHMRPHLLDFLVDSHGGLGLKQETLFLAISIIDRYTSKRVVYKRHYQLVGCAALWIASKYHDCKSKIPTLDELKLLCCHAYESHMFVQMEMHILSTLDWLVDCSTCDLYVDAYLNDVKTIYRLDPNVRMVALYLCEVSLFYKHMIEFSSADLAFCAVRLAMVVCNMNPGELYPGPYHDTPVTELSRCLDLMARACTSPPRSLHVKHSAPNGCAVDLVRLHVNGKARPVTPMNSTGYEPRQLPSPAVEGAYGVNKGINTGVPMVATVATVPAVSMAPMTMTPPYTPEPHYDNYGQYYYGDETEDDYDYDCEEY